MSTADDRELILRAQEGDLNAFGDLVRRHQAAVFNVAFRMFGQRSEAEDAAQETFLRAFRALGTFDVERPMAPWLKRIATNVCLNWLASARVKPYVTVADMNRPGEEKSSMDDWAHNRPTPEQELVTKETARQIRAAILKLPPPYRAVIELRHFQYLSYDEIGQTLGRSLNNVKSDLFRARRMLAELLGEQL